MKSFDLKLAGQHTLTLTPLQLPTASLAYSISIEGKKHGSIYTVENKDKGVIWKSDDGIDPGLADLIGKLIVHP